MMNNTYEYALLVIAYSYSCQEGLHSTLIKSINKTAVGHEYNVV